MNELLEKYGIDISGGNDAAIDQAENIQQKILNKLNYASGNAKKEMELNKQLSEIEKLITMLKNGEQTEDIYSFSLVDTDEKTMVNLDSFNIMKNGREDSKNAEALLKKADELMKHGLDKEALEQYEKAAELGNAEAYFHIGEYYEKIYNQTNDEENLNKLLEYFEKGYNKGSINAQAKLAIYYSQGICGEDKKKLADSMINQAIQSGNVKAKVILGIGYLNSPNHEKGIEMLKEAALNDSAEACYALADAYFNILNNDSEGRKWLALASEKNYPEAYFLMGVCLTDGLHGYIQDQQKGFEYTRTAADLGVIAALYNLGHDYKNGLGVGQNDVKAKEYFEKAAELGNILAIRKLSDMYYFGDGVPQDYGKTKEYLERSAAMGDGMSYCNLGQMYFNGNGVEQDYLKAKEYYEKAAELGISDGLNHIGNLYLKGNGVEQDYAKAREYYEKAAEQGNSDAFNNLGIIYASGNGVACDLEKAKEYFKRAAELGSSFGADNYEKACNEQQNAHEPTPDELNDLAVTYFNSGEYGKAKETFEKAAAMGSSIAISNLGNMYRDGLGMPQDYSKAIELYEKAAAMGNREAMYELGVFYRDSKCVPQDYNKAREYFEKAGDLGHNGALNNLGAMYYNGNGVARDLDKAKIYFKKAADLGNDMAVNNYEIACREQQNAHEPTVEELNNLAIKYISSGEHVKAKETFEKAAEMGNNVAMFNLGNVYSNGWGVPKDYGKAREWYEKAAEAGNVEALNCIGFLYLKGDGVVRDLEKAKEYFKRAADLGNQNGAHNYKNVCSLLQNSNKPQNSQESKTGNNPYSTYGVSDDIYSKAMNGDAEAQYKMGMSMRWKNTVEAVKWFRKAAKQYYFPAADEAANIYIEGRNGVPQDPVEAFNIIKVYAYIGAPAALISLGNMYMDGVGTNVNYSEAYCLFSDALEKGNTPAQKYLNICKQKMAANGITVSDEYRMNYRKRREEAERNNPFKAQNNAGAAAIPTPAANKPNSSSKNSNGGFLNKLVEISKKAAIITGIIVVVCAILPMFISVKAVKGFFGNVMAISLIISFITLIISQDKNVRTTAVILNLAGVAIMYIRIFLFS